MKTGTLPRPKVALSNSLLGARRANRESGRAQVASCDLLQVSSLGGALWKSGSAAKQASTEGLGRGDRAQQALVYEFQNHFNNSSFI